MTHNPAFEGARWAYAAYTLNPKIAAERGITQADMIGFASVPYKSEPFRAPEITWIKVSRDFKITEACRGMERCDELAGSCPHDPTHRHWFNVWQAIAISWASA